MNRVDWLPARYGERAVMRIHHTQTASPAWALVAGVMTAVFVVQVFLLARIVVQMMALRGPLADAAYALGGFFQRPFEGYSSGAVRTRGIFEPETVLAISAYAAFALVAAASIAAIRLSLHRALWRSLASLAADVGLLGLRLGRATLQQAWYWLAGTAAPALKRTLASRAANFDPQAGALRILGSLQEHGDLRSGFRRQAPHLRAGTIVAYRARPAPPPEDDDAA